MAVEASGFRVQVRPFARPRATTLNTLSISLRWSPSVRTPLPPPLPPPPPASLPPPSLSRSLALLLQRMRRVRDPWATRASPMFDGALEECKNRCSLSLSLFQPISNRAAPPRPARLPRLPRLSVFRQSTLLCRESFDFGVRVRARGLFS